MQPAVDPNTKLRSFLASPTSTNLPPPTPPLSASLTTTLTSLPTPYLLGVVFTVLLSYTIYTDYNTFLSLGPGGTRYDFLGYLKITFLRLFALPRPCTPPHIPPSLKNTGFLTPAQLPARMSERPRITGIAPHRQTNQRVGEDMFEMLLRGVQALAEATDGLAMGVSTFEKHGPALFSKTVVNETKGGEVVHLHRIDGSMHMTLHPEDVKVVLEKGWGERHPLARGGFCCRFVPGTFTMIYAPRTEKEVEVVLQIIRAGVCWVRGERVFEL